MKRNWVREKLKKQEITVGCYLGLGSPACAELLAHAGFDWVIIETEHNAVDSAEIQSMLMAVSSSNTIPIVRVPSSNPIFIQRALDFGAMGVLVPMVHSVEEARQVVRATRYPPEGSRSYGGLRATQYTLDSADYFRNANENMIVALILETREMAENLEEFAAIPGVDVIYLGPFDLCLSLGLDPMKQPHKEVNDIMARALEVGRRHNVTIGAVYGTGQQLLERKKQGFTMLGFTDYALLVQQAKEGISIVRETGTAN